MIRAVLLHGCVAACTPAALYRGLRTATQGLARGAYQHGYLSTGVGCGRGGGGGGGEGVCNARCDGDWGHGDATQRKQAVGLHAVKRRRCSLRLSEAAPMTGRGPLVWCCGAVDVECGLCNSACCNNYTIPATQH